MALFEARQRSRLRAAGLLATDDELVFTPLGRIVALELDGRIAGRKEAGASLGWQIPKATLSRLAYSSDRLVVVFWHGAYIAPPLISVKEISFIEGTTVRFVISDSRMLGCHWTVEVPSKLAEVHRFIDDVARRSSRLRSLTATAPSDKELGRYSRGPDLSGRRPPVENVGLDRGVVPASPCEEDTKLTDNEQAVHEAIWDYLRIIVRGLYEGNREVVRSTQHLSVGRDPTWSMHFARATQYLVYASISRRIEHRPVTTRDAEETAAELLPRLRALRISATDSEILNAIKLALVLRPEPWFSPDDPEASLKARGIWLPLIAVRISSLEEFEGLREGTGRWLIKNGLAADDSPRKC